MIDRDDQNKNPEYEPSQDQLRQLYGRLFGIALRHRNSRIDEHVALEGQRELPPHIGSLEDRISHSYNVTITKPELVLCGLEDMDRIDITYADPRMVDDEAADGIVILYALAGTKEEYLAVEFDSLADQYSVDYEVRTIDPDVDDEQVAFTPEFQELNDEELEARMFALFLDERPLDEETIERFKSVLRKVETGFGIN